MKSSEIRSSQRYPGSETLVRKPKPARSMESQDHCWEGEILSHRCLKRKDRLKLLPRNQSAVVSSQIEIPDGAAHADATQTLPGGKLAAYCGNSTGVRMRIASGSVPIGACRSDLRTD